MEVRKQEDLLRIKEVPQLSSFTEVFGLYVPFETHISHRRVSLFGSCSKLASFPK